MRKILIYSSLPLILIAILWVLGFFYYCYGSVSIREDHEHNADGIVALTGGDYRIATAFKLFAEKRAPNMLITGIHPNVKPEDIRRLYNGDIPECCLTYGYDARTTRGNGEETQKWAKSIDQMDSIILVTSEYHMFRGLLEVQHALPNITIYPYPVYSPYGNNALTFLRLMFLEYHKFLYRYFIIMAGL